MRHVCASAAILCVLLLSTSPAEAQLCAGNPSFANQPYQAALTAAFTEDAHGIGGEFAAGSDLFFARAGVGVLNYRELDALATEISASAGTEFATSQSGRVLVCPLAHVVFGVGPNFRNIDISSVMLGAGGSVGVIAAQSATLMVVPTFGLSVDYTRVTAEVAGNDTTDSDTSGTASLGVGFILNENIGILPEIAIPFSAGNNDPVFSIRLSFGFGS